MRWSRKPSGKRTINFARRYSAQLGFAAMVLVFLMITVGEGQAYNVDSSIKLASSLQTQNQNNGFFGKPQLLSDQTISTGEVQQQAAIIYKVAPGDSIVSIASRYNLSPGSVLDANHLSATAILKADQELLIPANDTNTSLAWLDAINKAKAEERAAAEKERQKQLALAQRNQTSRSSARSLPPSSGDIVVIGRKVGPYNGGASGYCTWLVHDIRKDLPNGMGNAINYLNSARANGMATGSVPRNGAVMVSRESSVGHVAIVQAVYSDGSFKVIEMNYKGWAIISTRIVHPGTIPLMGFVY